jgi:rhodanese-related sulfurtransferase
MAGKTLSLVDIREPHEHSLMDVNLAENVVDFVNIPLTRIAQFIYDMRLNNSHYPVVFICRSGSRSKLAASSLRRLGFENITHVIGGYALS